MLSKSRPSLRRDGAGIAASTRFPRLIHVIMSLAKQAQPPLHPGRLLQNLAHRLAVSAKKFGSVSLQNADLQHRSFSRTEFFLRNDAFQKLQRSLVRLHRAFLITQLDV